MEQQIKGNKVILRRPIESDAAFFARWYNEPEIISECGFTQGTTVEQELAAIAKCKESKDRDWYTITDKTGRVLGEAGLLRMFPEWHCTDLTLIIPDPDDQGKGYGTEAIELMFDLAFKQDFHRGRGVQYVGAQIL